MAGGFAGASGNDVTVVRKLPAGLLLRSFVAPHQTRSRTDRALRVHRQGVPPSMDRPHELPEGWPSRASVKGTIIIRTEGSTRRAKLLRRYWAVVAAMVALAGTAVLPGTAGTYRDLPSHTMTVGAAAPGSSPLGIPGTWNLELDSEFNGSSLNTSIWQTGWFGSGVTSPANTHEEDCYSPSNVTFPGDGTMHLSVTTAQSTCGGNTYPYTGSMITTNPDDGRASGGYQFTYGVVEALVYVPPSASSTIANWPAVWADGQTWPADGEDDILEGLGGCACFHFNHASSSGSRLIPAPA